MPSYTIYANADDHTAYSPGTSADVLSLANSADIGGSNKDQYFPRFDTSSVAGTLSTIALVLNVTGNINSSAMRVRDRAWTSVTGTNYASTPSSYPLLGTSAVVSGSGVFSTSLNSLTVSSAWALMVTLAANEDTSDFVRVTISTVEASGTTNDPYLSITTVTTTNYTLTADAGSFTQSGQAATLRYGTSLASAAGSFAQTGQTATLRLSAVLSAQAGSFSLTGANASLGFVYTLTATAGSFAAAGQDATLKVGNTLNAQAGSFTLTGGNAALGLGQRLTAAAGSFSITGSDAVLQKVSSHSITSLSGIATPYRPARVSPNPTPRAPRRDR